MLPVNQFNYIAGKKGFAGNGILTDAQTHVHRRRAARHDLRRTAQRVEQLLTLF
jgi:hypothetical protein